MRSKTILVVLCCLIGSAQAAPITWTLEGVTFDDGTTLEGGFDYDASTNTYSNVWMWASDTPFITYSDTYPGLFVLENSFGPGTSTGFQAYTRYDSFPDHYLHIDLDSAMTDAGGVISVSNTSYLIESYSFSRYENRDVVSGAISAVPIPAAVWLYGSAIAGLGWMRRKKTARG